MSKVQNITLAEDADGQRLDRYFRKLFAHISQGRIEKMCRKGEIRVDGGRVKPAARLETGQVLRVPPLPDPSEVPAAPAVKKTPKISDVDAEMIQNAVIYRDPDVIVLNKPAGLAVQGGSGQTRHVDGMAPALAFGEETPKLVHRLDKDTSGVLLLGRNGRAAAGLAAAFRARDTRKIYWAAVAGAPSPRAGTIRFGLVKAAGHGPHGAGEKMICIHPRDIERTDGAKRATSDFTTIDGAGGRASWVGLSPITGRTHQLRAHMAEIGHPIVGDGKYGTNRQTNEGDGWGAQLGGSISRKLHLHARSIALTHPTNKRPLFVQADLPDHMAQTWDFFGWNPKDAEKDPFEDLL